MMVVPEKKGLTARNLALRRCAVAATLFAIAATASGQQPATQTAPIYAANAKYVNGVAPGYWPTAGSGLTLNVSAGTAKCAGAMVTFAGGTLTMAASATNYVYLGPGCAPASNRTGFASNVPIATVVTGSSAITAITDDRTPFVFSPLGTISILSYNPDCTGATDATAALTAAIAAAGAAPGGVVSTQGCAKLWFNSPGPTAALTINTPGISLVGSNNMNVTNSLPTTYLDFSSICGVDDIAITALNVRIENIGITSSPLASCSGLLANPLQPNVGAADGTHAGVSFSASGGSFNSVTVFVRVVYTNAVGWTLSSPEAAITLSGCGSPGTCSITVTPPTTQPAGAIGMGVLASSTSNNETLINNSYASCTWVPTTFGTTANHGVPPVTNTTPFAAVRSFATYFHNVQLSTSNGQGATPPFNNMDGIVQQTLSSSGCCFVLDHVSVTGYHEAIAASGQPNGANNPLITGGSWIAGNDYGLVAGLGASWTVEGASVFQENYFGNYKFLSGSALIKGTYTEMDFASSGNSAGYGLQAGDNTNPCLLSGNCAAPQVDFSNNYVQCSGYTGTTGHYIIEAQVAVRSKFDYNNLTNCGSQGFLDDLQTNATAGIEVVGNQFHSGGPPTWFPAGTTGVCFTDVASTNLGLTGCPNWWNVGTVNATNLLLNGLPVGTVTLNELFPQGGLPGGAINVPTTSVLIFGLDSPANLAFSNIETYVASGSGTADVGFYLGAPGGTCTLLGDIATGGAGKSFSGINAGVPYAVTQGIETIPAGRYWVAVTAATGSTLAIHGNATATYGYSAAWTPSGYVGGSGVLPSGGTCPARNVALGNSLPAIWPF